MGEVESVQRLEARRERGQVAREMVLVERTRQQVRVNVLCSPFPSPLSIEISGETQVFSGLIVRDRKGKDDSDLDGAFCGGLDWSKGEE